MSKKAMNGLITGLMFWFAATTAQANELWREQGARAATRLAEFIEVLDTSLHEAYEQQSTEEFKKAIEDMHHIEDVLEHMTKQLPAAPFVDVCHDMDHLYEDLVQIRLDLIALGLETNPQVVSSWNNMVEVYNNELSPLFRSCPPHGSGPAANTVKTLSLF